MKRANRLMLVADYATTDAPTTGITLKELVDHWGVLPPKPVAP